MDKDQSTMAVAEATCRYSGAARFDDEVIVKAWIERAGTRMATFQYEMRLAGNDRRPGIAAGD